MNKLVRVLALSTIFVMPFAADADAFGLYFGVSPAPVYYPAPVVAYAPPPVAYVPSPRYVYPASVVYAVPAPVYGISVPYYSGYRRHHHYWH